MKIRMIPVFLTVFLILLSGCTVKNVIKSETSQKEEVAHFFSQPDEFVSGETGIFIYKPSFQNSLICLLGSNYPGEGKEYWKSKESVCQKNKGGEISWTIKAPEVTHETSYEFIAREYVNQTSSAVLKVFVISEDEKFISKEKKNTIEYFQGPVQISINPSSDYYVEKNGKTKIHFVIELKNYGDGYVFDFDKFSYSKKPLEISDKNINKIYFSVRVPDNVKITCDAEKNGGLYKIYFFEGVATTSCDAEISEDVISYKIYPIEIETYYGYYKDETMRVRVKPEY